MIFSRFLARMPRKPKTPRAQKKKHKYQRPAKKGHRSQICRTAKGGWAAVLPPGGFQSAAHRRCAKRAGHSATSPFRYVQIISQRANLKGQAHYARPGSCSPLFFSPQEAGDHRSPPLNLRVLRLVGSLGQIFCSSETLFKNDIEKTSKKMRKSRILASKTLPKSFQNTSEIDVPKNMRFFVDFRSVLLFFSIFDFLKMCVFPWENQYSHSFH